MSSFASKLFELAGVNDEAVRLRDMDWRLGERLLADLQPEDSLANAVTYVGIAPASALAPDLEWTIMRTNYDANGLIHSQAALQHVSWADRATNLYPGDGTRAFGTITLVDSTIPVQYFIFENDVYPEDYGWTGSQTNDEVAQNLTNFINAVWGGIATTTRNGGVVTITINDVGVAGNVYAVGGNNPAGAIASGQFTGGTDPE